MRNWLNGPWAPALIAGAVALIVRLVYVTILRSSVLFDEPIMDAAVHDGWARGTIHLFHRDTAYFRAPLYVWFLEFIYWFHPSYFGPRLAQALLGAATVGLVADIGRRFAGPVAGLAGGLLLAFCWPVIYFTGELLIVTLFMSLVMASLWAFLRAGQEDRPLLAYLGALLLGLSSIARPTSLVFLPAVVWLALWYWPRAGSIRLSQRRVLLTGGLLGLTLLPGAALTVRNAVVGDDFVFIASQGGVNFYIGNNTESDGRTAVVPGTSGTWLGGYQDTVRRVRQAEGRPVKPSEVSRYYFREGLRYLSQEPADALALYARKLRLLFGAGERSNNQNIHWWRSRNAFLRQPIFVSWAAMMALGIAGWFLMSDRRRAAPLAAFLILYSLGLLIFFINERFRTPLTIALACTAGIPVAQLIASVRARRWSGVGLILLLIAIPYTASSLDRIGFKENRIDADAFSRYTMGNAYLEKGDAESALQWYRESLAVARDFNLKHFAPVEFRLRLQRTRAFIRLRRDLDAAAELLALEAQAPDHPEVLTLRGWVHVILWEFGRAEPLFVRALQTNPLSAEAHEGLGWIYIERRNFANARAEFMRASRLDRKNAGAVAGLGVCDLWDLQEKKRAKERFLEALEIDWNCPWAHRMLGELYRLEKNIPLMIYHMRECARLDPHFTAARRLLNRAGVPIEHPPGTKYPYGP